MALPKVLTLPKALAISKTLTLPEVLTLPEALTAIYCKLSPQLIDICVVYKLIVLCERARVRTEVIFSLVLVYF
jgi:hypothetical protein